MAKRRVVVTGIGAVSPLGHDMASTWEGVKTGRSGIGRITHFDPTDYRSQVAAEVKDFDPLDHFPKRQVRRMDPFTQFGIVAAREAVAQSGLLGVPEAAGRTAVIVGSGIGGISTVADQERTRLERGPGRISPMMIPMILPETAASMIAIEFGFKGPNMAVTSACATGANAIGEATQMIRHGIVNCALAGGAEKSVMPLAVGGFASMRALSERNDDPEHASRPFDKDRDGFVIGEGSAVLVLESLDHAQARGATILAEIAGYGSNDDAYHITAPDPEGSGAVACMQTALADAGMTPIDIDYINAHGTSTPLNDSAETKAIKAVFGEQAYKVPVSSTKSVTGHLLGAAGALEAAIAIWAMQEGLVPPTMNLENPDPECDLDYVPGQARHQAVRTVLSNSFGFGGHNACLILRQMEA